MSTTNLNQQLLPASTDGLAYLTLDALTVDGVSIDSSTFTTVTATASLTSSLATIYASISQTTYIDTEIYNTTQSLLSQISGLSSIFASVSQTTYIDTEIYNTTQSLLTQISGLTTLYASISQTTYIENQLNNTVASILTGIADLTTFSTLTANNLSVTSKLAIEGSLYLPANGGSSIWFSDPLGSNTGTTTFGRLFGVIDSIIFDYNNSFVWRLCDKNDNGLYTALTLDNSGHLISSCGIVSNAPVTINSSLYVGTAATMNSTLQINGATTMNSNLIMNQGYIEFYGADAAPCYIYNSGHDGVFSNSDLIISSWWGIGFSNTAYGTMTSWLDTRVGTWWNSGNMTILSQLNVSGTTTIGNELYFNGTALQYISFKNNSYIGLVYNNADILYDSVSGDTALSSRAGCMKFGAGSALTTSFLVNTSNSVLFNNSVTMNSSLNISGNTTFNGSSYFNNAIYINAPSINFTNGITTQTILSSSNNLFLCSNGSICFVNNNNSVGYMYINPTNITFINPALFNSAISTNSSLNVSGNTTINGNLDVATSIYLPANGGSSYYITDNFGSIGSVNLARFFGVSSVVYMDYYNTFQFRLGTGTDSSVVNVLSLDNSGHLLTNAGITSLNPSTFTSSLNISGSSVFQATVTIASVLSVTGNLFNYGSCYLGPTQASTSFQLAYTDTALGKPAYLNILYDTSLSSYSSFMSANNCVGGGLIFNNTTSSTFTSQQGAYSYFPTLCANNFLLTGGMYCNYSTANPPISSSTGLGGSGDRLVLYQQSGYPYSIGIESSNMWSSVPNSDGYKWYIGGLNQMQLNSAALTVQSPLIVSAGITATAAIYTSYPMYASEFDINGIYNGYSAGLSTTGYTRLDFQYNITGSNWNTDKMGVCIALDASATNPFQWWYRPLLSTTKTQINYMTTAGAFYTTSDLREKKDIEILDSKKSYDKIKRINFKKWNWSVLDSKDDEIGVIAQEVNDIIPKAIKESVLHQHCDNSGNVISEDTRFKVNYHDINIHTANALKYLSHKVEEQENTIKLLVNHVQLLTDSLNLLITEQKLKSSIE